MRANNSDEISITVGTRKYGYYVWRKDQNSEMRTFFSNVEDINVSGNLDQRGKCIVWKQHLIVVIHKFIQSLSRFDINSFEKFRTKVSLDNFVKFLSAPSI